MRLIERIKKLEELSKPGVDYMEVARKFLVWIADNNRMSSIGGIAERSGPNEYQSTIEEN